MTFVRSRLRIAALAATAALAFPLGAAVHWTDGASAAGQLGPSAAAAPSAISSADATRRSRARVPNTLGIREAAIKQRLYETYAGDCNTGEQLYKPLPDPSAQTFSKKGFTVSYPQYSIGYGACGEMSAYVPYRLSGKAKDSRGKLQRGYYILRNGEPYCLPDGNCGFMCVAAKGRVVRILGGVTGDFGYIGVRRGKAMRAITLGSGAGQVKRLTFAKKSMTAKPDIFDKHWKRVSRAEYAEDFSGAEC